MSGWSSMMGELPRCRYPTIDPKPSLAGPLRYHEKDCTWEVRANIGAYEKLIEDFLEAARGEGLDVDERLEDTILLTKAAKYAYLWT